MHGSAAAKCHEHGVGRGQVSADSCTGQIVIEYVNSGVWGHWRGSTGRWE